MISSGLDADTQDRVVADVLERYQHKLVILSTHDQAIMQRLDEIVGLASAEKILQ